MAALTVTAAQVIWQSGPIEKDAVAGEAFAAGAVVYQADNGTWLKAQSDGTAIEAGGNNLGIALATADAASARLSIALAGAIVTLGAGAAPAAGTAYYVGTTAGSMFLVSDLASTNKSTPCALGIGSNKVKVLRDYDAGSVKP